MKKAPPFQIVLMMACVGALMFVSWLTVSSPENKEENKAQTTLIYFLEAVGKVPVEKLGKELHPTVRRQYNPETLKATLAELGLDKPADLSDFSQGEQRFEPRQWIWQFKNHGVPAAAILQYPEEVKISRRWHLRSYCEPQKDMAQATRELLELLKSQPRSDKADEEQNSPDRLSLGAEYEKLSADKGVLALAQLAEPEVSHQWNAKTTAGWRSEIRGNTPAGTQTLSIGWRVVPGKALHCAYEINSYRLGGTP